MRGWFWLIPTAILASASPALAAASGPSVTVRKIDASAAEQRAVMVQISNSSAAPICIAHDFSSHDRLSVWRNGRPLAMQRGAARPGAAPGCALLPPGRSRMALFRSGRGAPLPAGGGLKICYRIAWRNDGRTGQAPDMTRDVCEVFP
jgi:hypothetical protein